MAADVKRFLQKKPRGRALFLCDQNHILEQVGTRFKRILGDQYTYGNLTRQNKNLHQVTCLFGSLQAMKNWKEAFLPGEFDYVVVDESHHSKAETYESTIRYFQPECLLGVTATPDRRDLQNIREIFGEEAYSLPLEEAIARKLLAYPDYRTFNDNLRDLQLLEGSNGRRLNLNQLNRTIFLPMRDREMAAIIKSNAEEIEGPVRRIIFCPSINDTEEFRIHFGRQAATLHSGISRGEGAKRVAAFRGGELHTLLVVDMFNEGVDIPEVNQMVFRRGTASSAIFLQQLGRGLRKISGKERVQVLDFVANFERMLMLDDMWKEIIVQAGRIYPNIPPEKVYEEVGKIHFSGGVRDILPLIRELESAHQGLTAEQAKTYYIDLCTRLGRLAAGTYIREAGGPSLKALLRPFGGRLSNLREACGYDEISLVHDWSGWTAQEGIENYKALSGATALSAPELGEMLKTRKDLPSLPVFLGPFGGKIRDLQQQAGYELLKKDFSKWGAEDAIAAYKRLTNSQETTRDELKGLLAQDNTLPCIDVFLRPFGGKVARLLREAIGSSKSDRKRWDGWAAADSLRVYQELSEGKTLTRKQFIEMLQNRDDLPSIRTVLNAVEGGMPALQKQAGQTPLRPGWSSWGKPDSTKVYKELSAGRQLRYGALEKALVSRPDLPSIATVLKPFNGNLDDLRREANKPDEQPPQENRSQT